MCLICGMGIEDDNPRVKELKAQIASRLDKLGEDIEADRKVAALSTLAWLRTNLDKLLCNVGCSALANSAQETD